MSSLNSSTPDQTKKSHGSKNTPNPQPQEPSNPSVSEVVIPDPQDSDNPLFRQVIESVREIQKKRKSVEEENQQRRPHIQIPTKTPERKMIEILQEQVKRLNGVVKENQQKIEESKYIPPPLRVPSQTNWSTTGRMCQNL